MSWLAHHWQDTIFGAGGFFFALSLVPTLRSKTAEVPLKTSVPTAAILALYVAAEWTVHLRLAAIAGVFSSAAWWLVAIFRRPRKKAVAPLRLDIQAMLAGLQVRTSNAVPPGSIYVVHPSLLDPSEFDAEAYARLRAWAP